MSKPVPNWARDPFNGGCYYTCGKCGAFYELVRPGKFQPTCDCHRICPEHGCLDVYRLAPSGHRGGGVFGYVCPLCHPPCGCAPCQEQMRKDAAWEVFNFARFSAEILRDRDGTPRRPEGAEGEACQPGPPEEAASPRNPVSQSPEKDIGE